MNLLAAGEAWRLMGGSAESDRFGALTAQVAPCNRTLGMGSLGFAGFRWAQPRCISSLYEPEARQARASYELQSSIFPT